MQKENYFLYGIEEMKHGNWLDFSKLSFEMLEIPGLGPAFFELSWDLF